MLVCCDAPSSQSRRVSYGNTEGQTVQFFLQCTNCEKNVALPSSGQKATLEPYTAKQVQFI